MVRLLLILLFILPSSEAVSEDNRLIITPPEWDFGTIAGKEKVSREILIENKSSEKVTVTFIPTCDCLFAYPSSLQLSPGEKTAVILEFDPAGYSGIVEKDFIVHTSLKEMGKALYPVHGRLPAQGTKEDHAGKEIGQAGKEARVIHAFYYFSPGCRSCERFLSRDIRKLEEEFEVTIIVNQMNILEPEIYENYHAFLEELGEEERAYPALIVGRHVLQGEREINRKVRACIASSVGELPENKLNGAAAAVLPARHLTFLPILAAGLLDGINPCAFTTLIFLLAALAIAGRGRREVLIIGLFFTLSVFVTYFLIGLGFLKVVRAAFSFPIISRIIRWILVAVLVTFAALSIYDFTIIRSGRPAKILLQLPSALKRRIHSSIRAHAKSAAIVASSLLLGFLVSVFELACTGQVYFPILVYFVRIKREASGFLYLFVYNLGFIIPLIVVFVLTYLGIGSDRITSFFQKSMSGVKLALAFLFLCLAAIIIIT